MTQRTPGRHRRPGRLSTASHSLTRSAAVAATSTGLVAGAVVSAHATPDSFVSDREVAASGALQQIGVDVPADRTLTVERPAVATPAPEELSAAVSPAGFGTSGFTAVTPVVEPVVEAAPVEAAPEAAPVAAAPEAAVEQAPVTQAAPQSQAQAQVAQRTETSASRTNERTQTPAAAPVAPRSQPTPPAPRPAPPAPPAPAPEPPAAPAPTGGVLAISAGLVGVPYVYGGATPAGFDCSGFTSYVYAQVGISLPRTAAAQQAAATPVSNPQPGDLVFYGYPAGHVGLYAGNGMMYDSPRPGKFLSLRPVFAGVSGYGRVG